MDGLSVRDSGKAGSMKRIISTRWVRRVLMCVLVFSMLFILLTGCSSGNELNRYPNLYWPGNFEQTLYDGNLSKANGVVLSDSVNATPDGTRSWFLKPKNYQHLELLTQGTGDFTVDFKAKATDSLQMKIPRCLRRGASIQAEGGMVKLAPRRKRISLKQPIQVQDAASVQNNGRTALNRSRFNIS